MLKNKAGIWKSDDLWIFKTKDDEPSTKNEGCFPSCCSKEKFQEPQENSQDMIEIAPLHIAAKKPDSISTR